MDVEQLVELATNEWNPAEGAILAVDTRSGELSEVSSVSVSDGRVIMYLDHPSDEDYDKYG